MVNIAVSNENAVAVIVRGVVAAAASALLLGGCGTMSAAGPTSKRIERLDAQGTASAVRIVDVDATVARRVVASGQTRLFSEVLGDAVPAGSILGPGDALDISIWEAPPATLFGATGMETRSSGGNNLAARLTGLPEQTISETGYVTVPFAGAILAAGRTPQQVAAEIVSRLRRKAHMPQVQVRLAQNATKNVTVVGEVSNSLRMPLTAKGERLLDALAAAGGLRQPLGKTSVQVTRGDIVLQLPMDAVVRDPRQNIMLKSGDVVTALYQPFSFTVLGAAGRNDELNFEAQGITLAQALGRVGGLQDARANPRGVFIFRFEDPAALTQEALAGAQLTPEGKVPVIYRIDMRDPATLFVAQSFPVRNKDVLYVSNAPLADFQKFVNIVSSLVFPFISLQNTFNQN